MDSWLKFRSKTPLSVSRAPTGPSTPSIDNMVNPFDNAEDVEEEIRIRPASRVSSLLSFGKQTTPTMDPSSFASPTFSFEKFIAGTREAESVWHDPSPDQMVESLKVSMMSRGNFEQVPVEYNSSILHILEAYWKQSNELKKKDQEINELKAKLNYQIDQIEVLGKEWSTKEGQYKVELKNLEVMVANGVVGLDKVTLARSKSLLDRTNSPIEDRIRKIREGSDSSIASRSKILTTLADEEEKEVKLSKMFSTKKRPMRERHITERFRPYKDPSLEHEMVLHPQPLRSRHTMDLREEPRPSTTYSKHHPGAGYDSSITSEDEDAMEQVPRAPIVLSPKSDGKPLPDIPMVESNEAIHDPEGHDGEDPFEETRTKSKTSELHSRTMSFVPGDDSFEWRKTLREADAKWPPMDSYAQLDTLSSGSRNLYDADAIFSTFNPDEMRRKTLPSESNMSTGHAISPGQSQLLAKHIEYQDPEKPKRGDSNSSTITAIRDRSARNSADMGSRNGGRKPLTSNAAIAAATRAMAAGDTQVESPHRWRSALQEDDTESHE